MRTAINHPKIPLSRNLLLVLILCLSGSVNLRAQPGYIDTTFEAALYNHFGTGDRVSGTVNASILLPDGKILVGGDFSSYNGQSCHLLARLNADGSLDTAFHFQNYFSTIMCMKLLDDGKILLAGEGDFGAIKIYQNGTLDPLFQMSPLTGYVKDMAVQSDDKIICVGYNNTFLGGLPDDEVIRFNPDGSIDPTFSAPATNFSSTSQVIYAVALQSDEKIVIGGSFTAFDGVQTGGITRLNSDGSTDLSFDVGTGVDGIIYSIAVQPNDKVIATGYFTNFNGTQKNGIVRLLADGTFDPTFGAGVGAQDVYKVILKDNGDIVIGGYFSGYDGLTASSLAVLDPDGILQSTTNSVQGNGSGDGVRTINVQPDNKILVGGFVSTHIGDFHPGGILRIMPDGSTDSTFVPWTGASGWINDIEPLVDGKTIIVGDFRSYDGIMINRIARLNGDGTLDQTFQVGSGANDVVKTLAIQADGKILIGGVFTMINGIARHQIARLNVNGTLDLSFNPTLPWATVYSIEIQPNGKILLSGSFFNSNGLFISGIIRLNQDGSMDAGFNSSAGGGSIMALQPDGKIVFLGSYYNNVELGINPTLRVNPDGSLDTTYSADTYVPIDIKTIKLQADNKILLAGYQGSTSKIIRLNSDGTPDPTFNSGTGTDDNVFDILPLSNGQMIIAGEFMHYNGQPTSTMARLNADGSLDNTFHMQDYIGNVSDCIKVVKGKPDGQLLIGGWFKTYDGKPAHCIARIHHDIPETSAMELTFDGINPVTCDSFGAVTAIPAYGTPPYTFEWETVPVSGQASIEPEFPGLYSVTVTDSMGYTREKSILIPGYGSTGFDLSSYLAYGEFRPGFVTNLILVPTNDGCVAADAQIKLILPDLLDFNAADPAPSSVSGDTLTWNFPQLLYDANPATIQVSVTTSTDALIGDSILLTSYITPVGGDDDVQNNMKIYESPIVNAYDPNYIAVYPAGKCAQQYVSTDQVLTYTIHFQNTGNSQAINIHLLDTLDASLDVSTLRIIAQSHEVWAELLPGNVLRFNFDNIHLPDSTSNEEASHGHVVFEVKPIAGSLHGTAVSSQAGIYFDFNPAVITNTVVNTLFSGDLEAYSCELGLSNAALDQLMIIPNPFADGFSIERTTGGNAEISVMDLQGKIMIAPFNTSEKTVHVPAEQLQSGIYLLRFKTKDVESVVKIVKE